MIDFSVYLVDDDASIRKGIGFGLKKHYQIETFACGKDAINTIRHRPPDLVLLDIGLPDMNGIDALKEIKAIDNSILVIMITGFENVQTVVSAMKLGALDYIIKPIEMETIKNSIDNALGTIRLQKELQLIQEKLIRENMPCIIGESNAIQDVMRFVEKAAQSPDTPILITGESGTGKELIAQAIHYKSPLLKGPFVAVNCAAIPRELIESELFGYEKGAFSGASATGKKGLIEQANHGTLLLDEIGDLMMEAQAKLLRFLESGRFYKVGGTKEETANVRCVSATNKNIKELIDQNLFRVDLYYRIGVIEVKIPSLKERREDILPIARYFLAEFSNKFKKPLTGWSQEVESLLLEFSWEGNVRELKNLIERAVLVGTGSQIELADLGLDFSWMPHPSSSNALEGQSEFPGLPAEGLDLEALERHYLVEALKVSEGNDSKAAQLLGMSYYAFRYRKKKLDKTDQNENSTKDSKNKHSADHTG
ncbi:MAG: sigma-54-dependent Fis family transcriptional regulator [Deltaproteobacteria bacterium]|jgi:DNA-binding NtrC family response regulator|nr:sigma-54-dependent Fis family transcriptional regulator [Deltaproteobacteria bacterium]MBT4268724.1 sigma-54-dependent Fis family transcriptional regulator [Deltaproteobacteria bacterium]MBT4638398.1 sigma-54-dependent Fis family transcriptional regulator [Deltaproteobacteria bacterium]MBT6500236.1 sigma-54-dependent Fis family transcriptional regulator [Deltaproteobacteria bacterium]MBT6613936.1 sigma-54-dependent Fis family transcriptional regulator [Deltaproteobacteria bacterium]